jgi:hypothetical protein
LDDFRRFTLCGGDGDGGASPLGLTQPSPGPGPSSLRYAAGRLYFQQLTLSSNNPRPHNPPRGIVDARLRYVPRLRYCSVCTCRHRKHAIHSISRVCNRMFGFSRWVVGRDFDPPMARRNRNICMERTGTFVPCCIGPLLHALLEASFVGCRRRFRASRATGMASASATYQNTPTKASQTVHSV